MIFVEQVRESVVIKFFGENTLMVEKKRVKFIHDNPIRGYSCYIFVKTGLSPERHDVHRLKMYAVIQIDQR